MDRRKVYVRVLCGLIVGIGLAALVDMQSVQSWGYYRYIPAGLLAVGLYAATFEIDLDALRKHARMVIEAVTVGVMVKAAWTGLLVALIFQQPFYLVLGLAVAQMDPLSVSALESDSKLSEPGKTVLRAWAALDDPVTVVLTLYLPFLVVRLWGSNGFVAPVMQLADLKAYAVNLGLNVAFAAVAFYLWRIIRLWRLAQYGVLGVVFAAMVLFAGTHWFWMFGVALAGLDIRPAAIQRFLKPATWMAFVGSVILLGTLLTSHYTLRSLLVGVVLGAAAYTSQMVAAPWLARKLPVTDRIYLSFAQQNGVTAIILSLLLETVHPGSVAIVATAILVVGVLYETCNRLVVPRLLRRRGLLSA